MTTAAAFAASEYVAFGVVGFLGVDFLVACEMRTQLVDGSTKAEPDIRDAKEGVAKVTPGVIGSR